MSVDYKKLIGGTVDLTSGKKGILRFYGHVSFAPGAWCGIELFKDDGTNDGSINNVRYFSCKKNHGLFCQESDIFTIIVSSDEFPELACQTPTIVMDFPFSDSVNNSCQTHVLSLSGSLDKSGQTQDLSLSDSTVNFKEFDEYDSDKSLGILPLELYDNENPFDENLLDEDFPDKYIVITNTHSEDKMKPLDTNDAHRKLLDNKIHNERDLNSTQVVNSVENKENLNITQAICPLKETEDWNETRVIYSVDKEQDLNATFATYLTEDEKNLNITQNIFLIEENMNLNTTQAIDKEKDLNDTQIIYSVEKRMGLNVTQDIYAVEENRNLNVTQTIKSPEEQGSILRTVEIKTIKNEELSSLSCLVPKVLPDSRSNESRIQKTADSPKYFSTPKHEANYTFVLDEVHLNSEQSSPEDIIKKTGSLESDSCNGSKINLNKNREEALNITIPEKLENAFALLNLKNNTTEVSDSFFDRVESEGYTEVPEDILNVAPEDLDVFDLEEMGNEYDGKSFLNVTYEKEDGPTDLPKIKKFDVAMPLKYERGDQTQKKHAKSSKIAKRISSDMPFTLVKLSHKQFVNKRETLRKPMLRSPSPNTKYQKDTNTKRNQTKELQSRYYQCQYISDSKSISKVAKELSSKVTSSSDNEKFFMKWRTSPEFEKNNSKSNPLFKRQLEFKPISKSRAETQEASNFDPSLFHHIINTNIGKEKLSTKKKIIQKPKFSVDGNSVPDAEKIKRVSFVKHSAPKSQEMSAAVTVKALRPSEGLQVKEILPAPKSQKMSAAATRKSSVFTPKHAVTVKALHPPEGLQARKIVPMFASRIPESRVLSQYNLYSGRPAHYRPTYDSFHQWLRPCLQKRSSDQKHSGLISQLEVVPPKKREIKAPEVLKLPHIMVAAPKGQASSSQAQTKKTVSEIPKLPDIVTGQVPSSPSRRKVIKEKCATATQHGKDISLHRRPFR